MRWVLRYSQCQQCTIYDVHHERLDDAIRSEVLLSVTGDSSYEDTDLWMRVFLLRRVTMRAEQIHMSARIAETFLINPGI